MSPLKSAPSPLKLVIFAHTPPPCHGQSLMVELMLTALGGDRSGDRSHPNPGETANGSADVECYHVNCRLSDHLQDIGRASWGKVWRLLRYCAQAHRRRWRYGADTLYYVPAPGKRAALYRDWLVMLLCRPFFRSLVLHWHAVGLGAWLETSARGWERWLTHRLLGGADLSLVLAQHQIPDQSMFVPRQVCVLPNAIPDPCPDFQSSLLPERLERTRRQRAALEGKGDVPVVFHVLFLALCLPEKGFYDAIEAVAQLNRQFTAAGGRVLAKLTVAGDFPGPAAEAEFHARIARPDLAAAGAQGRGPQRMVEYAGFVSGAAKDRLLRASDCLCLPTYYPVEGQPVSLIEALAYGLPVVATRWRAIPEMLPAESCWLVEPRRPEQIAAALRNVLTAATPETLREHYQKHYRIEAFAERLRHALARLPQ